MGRKLPIGIQGFEKLRTEGFVYVDKTEYVYRLAHHNVPYFLSRPRRFGKSLLISTLKAYWEGKKELFSGLKIEKLEEDNREAWQPYPVFLFDFNGVNYRADKALEASLDEHLHRWEKEYGLTVTSSRLGERFRNLIMAAWEKNGRRVVILVDEYDKPLLDVIEDEVMREHNKEVFRGFFGTLKSFDEYIQFILITGVSKFHKVSIFSDMNQLNDISLNKDFSGMCGIVEDEIKEFFTPEINELASAHGLTREACLATLKKQYDGYCFSPEGKNVYNPYSLLKALFEKDFGTYWYETGTPSFLVKRLKESHFDVRRFTDHTIYASEGMLKDYTGENLSPVPLLYQTGYLTIADYDRDTREFRLAFPNDEVKYALVESMIPEYSSDYEYGSGKDIFALRRYIEGGDLEGIRDVLTALFASIPYTREGDPFENYFQSIIFLVFTLLGKFVLCEMHTFSGRIDCRVETKKYVYLFEFKRDVSADDALTQIDSKEYTLPFTADRRKIFKVGVSFDSATRKLTGFKWEEY